MQYTLKPWNLEMPSELPQHVCIRSGLSFTVGFGVNLHRKLRAALLRAKGMLHVEMLDSHAQSRKNAPESWRHEQQTRNPSQIPKPQTLNSTPKPV